MSAKYYAQIDGEQRGPFTLEELPAAGVRPSTYIWTKGMPDWQKAEENADVCRLFRNHLYDVMHPADQPVAQPGETGAFQDPYKIQPDEPRKARTRFDSYLAEAGEHLPTLEEIEAQKDKTIPPVSMVGYAWIVTLFCFFPTGIAALVYAYRSKKSWKDGDNAGAYENCRLAKMWTGVSFFIGLIGYGFLLAYA